MPQSQKQSNFRPPAQEAAPVEPVKIPVNPLQSPAVDREEKITAAGIVLDDVANRRNRILNAVSIALPLLGTVAAIAFWPVFTPTITTAVVFAVFFVVTGLGITMGLHRYFAHRSFATRSWLGAILAVVGTWAFQGPIRRWVADHRRHHRFSDQMYDPHSPYFNDDGAIEAPLHRFANAHFLWMLRGLRSNEARYAADIDSDPVADWCSRHYWLTAGSGIAAPMIVGVLLGGVNEAVACGLWAGFVRVALLHQLTWSVNSFGHMVGAKQPEGVDESRDNPILAIMILGEGLHAFHHRYPNAAVKAPILFDATGGLILLMKKLGLVWRVRRAGGDEMQKRAG